MIRATMARLSRTASMLLSHADKERLSRLSYRSLRHGYDPFGMHPDGVALGLSITRFLYDVYFRVKSNGVDNIPAEGRAILAANHSGMVPIDALMIYTDVVRNTVPPRVPRAIMDFFVPMLPSISTLFARAGGVGGARGTMRYLLEHDELVLVFPEGVPGISKGFFKRYQLQQWRVGHVEMAIRHQAPVVPVGVVGAEESWPQIARLDKLRLFGAPHVPVPLTPLPLPAKFHIYYGAPIDLPSTYAVTDADDPEALKDAAETVKLAVKALLTRGLVERKGSFR